MAHNAKAFSSRTWLTIGVVGALLLLALAFVREYVRNSDIATELARMQAENEALNAQHFASLQLLSQLSTETAVEGEARSKLNLAEEGETMYVVRDDGSSVPVADQASAQKTDVAYDPALSNPAKWFYYFFAPREVSDDGAL